MYFIINYKAILLPAITSISSQIIAAYFITPSRLLLYTMQKDQGWIKPTKFLMKGFWVVGTRVLLGFSFSRVFDNKNTSF